VTSTLIWMKWPTNSGYALSALERLFFDTAVNLAAGDAGRVFFGFPDTSSGPPRSLPEGFKNVVTLDLMDGSPAALARLESFAREQKIDLVIPFDVQPVHASFAALRRAGVGTIVCYWGAPISSRMPWWRLTLKRMELRLSRSRANGLIFESNAMADLATDGRGVPKTMIDVVPLGVDIERFKPEPSTYVYEALGIPRHQKVVVFSGHCTPRKGIKTLVEAATELLAVRRRQDVCFVICGDRPGEKDAYEAMYAGLGIDQSIRFAGYRNDLLRIFQSAYCGVIPSSGWDSFTLSSVEMAATGLPIVASRLQGLAEAVRDRETGLLFEPGNAAALVTCLVELLDDPQLAADYGRAGRVRCVRELTLEQQRERFLEALRRHLPPHRAA
jgi:glycosyltransferase involved in cell wall biosynthesis